MIGWVAIIGVGYIPFRSMALDVSYKELIFEVAVRTYEAAGVALPSYKISEFAGLSLWQCQINNLWRIV